MKLYEITTVMNKLEETVEDKEELNKYLDGVKMKLKDKATNILYAIKNWEAPITAIDNEIKRLKEMKMGYQNRVANMKEYISYNMQKSKIEKIETDIATFSFRKSSSVEITDEERLDKKFIVKITKTSPDKIAIKKAIQSGEDVEGASIKENKNLQIK